jgi:hypothetical protein
MVDFTRGGEGAWRSRRGIPGGTSLRMAAARSGHKPAARQPKRLTRQFPGTSQRSSHGRRLCRAFLDRMCRRSDRRSLLRHDATLWEPPWPARPAWPAARGSSPQRTASRRNGESSRSCYAHRGPIYQRRESARRRNDFSLACVALSGNEFGLFARNALLRGIDATTGVGSPAPRYRRCHARCWSLSWREASYE